VRCSDPLFGPQFAHGWVGALAFSAAMWRLKVRDKYIGWTEGARRANLDRVVCNSRLLILPSVHVANLASHVLSLVHGPADGGLDGALRV